MMLFENESINITKIHTVAKYDFNNSFPVGTTKNYPIMLPSYELIFFLEGESITHFAGVKISDRPNSVRYLPKGVANGEYRVEKLSTTVCIDIYFDTDSPMPNMAMSYQNMAGFKNLFMKIYNIWQSKRPGYYAEAMSVLYMIVSEFGKNRNRYSNNSSRVKLEASHSYIINNYCRKDFNYKEMCAASGLSYDYFKELFKYTYGVTPQKYITAMRISKAKELLITGHFSVTEIAEECGFENVYYFSTVFKKETGLPPSRYLSAAEKNI